jgi:ribokinase
MAAAEILFMSDELLPMPAVDWASGVMRHYNPRILVIGMGASGALLCTRGGKAQHVPAETSRPVVNTIGAGDALFSAFLHCYLASGDAHLALEKAVLFASHKIGAISAADGFLDARELEALYARTRRNPGKERGGGT